MRSIGTNSGRRQRMNASASNVAANGQDTSALTDLVEDIVNRLQDGDTVNVEAYIREHPEHAEGLRRLLPAMEVLAELGRSAPVSGVSVPPAGADPAAPAGTLGDFRLIREVGR